MLWREYEYLEPDLPEMRRTARRGGGGSISHLQFTAIRNWRIVRDESSTHTRLLENLERRSAEIVETSRSSCCR